MTIPTLRDMLQLQTTLLDDKSFPDEFDVELASMSKPPIPHIVVYDGAKKPVIKITPMRKGRYRLTRIDRLAVKPIYFHHLPVLSRAVLGIVEDIHDRSLRSRDDRFDFSCDDRFDYLFKTNV